jgi:hypothetical protein
MNRVKNIETSGPIRQEIMRLLWSLKNHYRFHKNPLQDSILRQVISMHILTLWHVKVSKVKVSL